MRDYASLFDALVHDLGVSPNLLAGPLTSDLTNEQAAKHALAGSFYKKLCPNGNTRAADEAALKKFLAINDRLPEHPEDFPAENEAESCFYDYYRDNLRVALGLNDPSMTFGVDSIREFMGVGPGAAQKADATNMVTKLFESPLSYTHEFLLSLYRAALIETGYWADAEMQRFREYGNVKVDGGKIFFAPKNKEISRTCCTEASVNMLVQKACGGFLEEVLKRSFGIDLATQPDFNRELARKGSEDGSFGTIDLVSASDSVGLQRFKTDFPDCSLKGVMMVARSERAVLPDGQRVSLKMVSTMGNGFTFPLQTLLFASAVRACYKVMGFPCYCPRTQFGVFGDDIVVRRETYEFVVRMLQKLGFEVNVGKSFNTGGFRESCGSDYFRGYNIRGVYIRSLETPQEVYSAFNRLVRWSALHGIKLQRTLRMLQSWVRDIRVPRTESDDAGFHVPARCAKLDWRDSRGWSKYRAYTRRVDRRKVDELSDSGDSLLSDKHAVGFLSGTYRRRDISLTSTRIIESDGLTDLKTIWLDWPAMFTVRDKPGARARYQVQVKSIPFWDLDPTQILRIGVGVPGGADPAGRPFTGASQREWELTLMGLFSFW